MAFEATGDTPAELFEAAAEALFESMADLGGVRLKIRREIRLQQAQIDQLLFDWLSELIYLKDAEQLLFGRFAVQLTKDNGWQLTATTEGETIDPQRHDLRTDVKAVTYHQFEVAPSPTGGWRARVVLDV